MSADLHIHILEGVKEGEVADFSRGTLGSKHFDMTKAALGQRNRTWEALFEKVGDTPNLWIGEVSWLKAAILDAGEDKYVPNAVGEINELIGEELPVLDDALIENICGAMAMENTTQYRLQEHGKVLEFLTEHKGKQVFTVSW